MVEVDERGGSSGLEYREREDRAAEEVRVCDGSKVPKCGLTRGDENVGLWSGKGPRRRGGASYSNEADRRR